MLGWSQRLDAKRPLVIGHRGYAARYPENTMASFEAAVAAGADAVELDVRLTRDRVPVVIHDDTVDRTTADGTGRVNALELDALRRLDAGSRFDAACVGERIPTLAEVLDALGGRTLVNVELKPDAYDGEATPGDLALQVGRAIESRTLEDTVVVSCFDARHLTRLRHAHPRVSVSCLLDAMPPPERLREVVRATGAILVSPDLTKLDRTTIRARLAELRVVPWTANDDASIAWCLEVGMHGFFTDEVERAIRMREEL